MPKPKRQHVTPSIDLSKAVREWKTVQARNLHAGDIVPDFGKVEEIMVWKDVVTNLHLVRLTSITQKTLRLKFDDEIFAFTSF